MTSPSRDGGGAVGTAVQRRGAGPAGRGLRRVTCCGRQDPAGRCRGGPADSCVRGRGGEGQGPGGGRPAERESGSRFLLPSPSLLLLPPGPLRGDAHLATGGRVPPRPRLLRSGWAPRACPAPRAGPLRPPLARGCSRVRWRRPRAFAR